jgi:uncharacterized protein (TIGR02268 family)
MVLLALVLMDGPAGSQPGTATCQTGVQHVELQAAPMGELPTVCISPGQATTLSFDTDFVQESLTVEGREKFTKVDVGQSTLKLVPSERLVPGERLKVTVRFRDNDAPAGAAMTLVVHAIQAATHVEVHREKRTVESCQRELKEKEAALQQCRADNGRLRDERGGPGGIIGLRTAKVMDRKGVSSHEITESITQAAKNAFTVTSATAFRSSARVAVEVFLEVPENALAWKPEGATLTLQGGKRSELNVVALWPTEPLAPSVIGSSVSVEAETSATVETGTFTLKLWDASGTRTVIISGIKFP